ncbi:MAG: endonuclease/exonuclease/phosphatase family protein [Verrucomicrobiota bacterium]
MPCKRLILHSAIQKLWNHPGRALALISAAYGVVLVALALGFRYMGELNALSSVLIYLPPGLWLLPLTILSAAAALFHRRLLIVLLFILGVGLVFTQFRVGFGRRSAVPGEKCVTLVTNNIGQSNHLSMAPFVQREKPDFLLIQDAFGRIAYYKRTYPACFVAAVGEFVLISKFPITSATIVPESIWAKRTPAAALFRVQWPVHPLSVYGVHIPTPRPDFALLRGHGFLVELLRGRIWQRYAGYREAMRQRVSLAERLSKTIASDPNPVLVGGDFNMPGWGYIHSLFSSRLSDAFEASGSGFGLTFPGATYNPLSLFGPWLRIDYAFCNRWWVPLSCSVEPHRASQHRAVAATFSFASQENPQ